MATQYETWAAPKIEGAVKDNDLQFDVDNRGKESLIVDLTTEEEH